MSHFLHQSLDSTDLEIIHTALAEWCRSRDLSNDSVERELCAAALVNMFREGNRSVPDLLDAMNRHKSLSMMDIAPRTAASR